MSQQKGRATGKPPKEVNEVHQQEILRQFIRKEEETAKNFDANWGYLKGDMTQQLNQAASTTV